MLTTEENAVFAIKFDTEESGAGYKYSIDNGELLDLNITVWQYCIHVEDSIEVKSAHIAYYCDAFWHIWEFVNILKFD